MDQIPLWAQLLALAAVPAFSFGAAWAGVKSALNGMRAAVGRTETVVEDIRADMTDIRERLARLEGPAR